MSSDADKTPRWIIYVGGLASIATIIGVIIAYLAYVHPGSPSESGSPIPTSTIPKFTQTSFPSSSTGDLAGATSTIDTFCQFLNSGAIQQAYALTSSGYQNQHGIDQFTSQFNNQNLLNGGCVHNSPAVSGNTVVVSLTMNRINPSDGVTSSTHYTAILISDPQSASWVINSLQ